MVYVLVAAQTSVLEGTGVGRYVLLDNSRAYDGVAHASSVYGRIQ